MWRWGRAAAGALRSRRWSARHLTVPAAMRGSGLGWGASGTGTPGPPRLHPGSPAQSPRRGGDRRAPARGTARSPSLSPRRFRRAAAGVCLLVPRRLPRRMASCDRGDPQFPELSGGGSGSGSRARSGLLAAAPTSRPFSSPRPSPEVPPGRDSGGGRRGRFQRRKWLLDARERLICHWGRADWRSGGAGREQRRRGVATFEWRGRRRHVAAEGAARGCATRRCHHCTGANSGEGAGSYFPLLPRCCFCRLGRRTRGRVGGGDAAALRTRRAGAARWAPGAGRRPHPPPRVPPQPAPPPPSRAGLGRPQGPPLGPFSGSPSRAHGGGRSPRARWMQRANKKAGDLNVPSKPVRNASSPGDRLKAAWLSSNPEAGAAPRLGGDGGLSPSAYPGEEGIQNFFL